MSLPRAASFLLWASARNRLRRQLARLKEPRYAFATAVGLLYFWSIFFRQALAAPVRPLPRGALPAAELVMAAIGLTSVATAWLFGDEQASFLRFTEAEAQLLFSAPVSRRALVSYKLLRQVLLTGLSALLTTLFLGLRLAPHPALFALGTWLGFASLSLHFTAASLARASLAAHGLSGLRRQLASVAVGAALLAALALAVRAYSGPLPEGPLDARALLGWAVGQLGRPPLSWLLYPVLAPVRVALAPDLASALRHLPGAVGVAAAHFLWALSTDVAFEEAALEAARRRATRVEAVRAGKLFGVSRVRPPFRLGALGRPEVALLWKNGVGLLRANALRTGLVLGYLALFSPLAPYALLHHRAEWKFAVASALCAALAGYLALLGPLLLRSDFREDLPQMDLLRALPLTGEQAALGEVLAPALALTALQWALLLAGALLSLPVRLEALPPAERLALALAAALVLPGLSLLSLLLQNAAALLFPAWVSTARGVARGFEATGQRLLTLVANLLVLVVGLLPAALLGGLVLWAAWGLGPLRAPLAAAAAAAVLLAEARLGLRLLGQLFERFDVGR